MSKIKVADPSIGYCIVVRRKTESSAGHYRVVSREYGISESETRARNRDWYVKIYGEDIVVETYFHDGISVKPISVVCY